MEERDTSSRLRRIQDRINDILRDSPQEHVQSRFSPYLEWGRPNLQEQLEQAAAARKEGIDGIEAALEAFDRLYPTEDHSRLRYALMVFLTHNPEVQELGLHIPSLQERSPWKLSPNRRENDISKPSKELEDNGLDRGTADKGS